MSTAHTAPSPGLVRIDRAHFDHELNRRALRGQDVARAIGLTIESISRIRNGGQMRPETFRRIAEFLSSTPVIEGADLLLPQPEFTKKAAPGSPSGTAKADGGTPDAAPAV